ncbi:5-formyltetrahydrofolate cyclo-ligase [Thalassoporum mexicanum]|uniref:5-formyltetrahydrofolate cyclo-ligase n=1 Tax=Thalassoporum mexicanum TaxID=3457544 RepID=UPI0005A0BA87|nr:5-formyltetrahydrofolate cyclo-ligase [Pseudanabaena sp. PCC 7367]
MSKPQLRKQLLISRKNLPVTIWRQQSQAICDRLLDWHVFQRSQVILAYTSFRQEPDLQYLWQQTPQKSWVFPRCVGSELVWHQVAIADFADSMTAGTFGILEPITSLPQINLIDINIDLILTPTLACDRQGTRLGYGGGYYDRFFAQVNNCHQPGHSYRVGVLFAENFGVTIPSDKWDIPLQAVCTETEIHIIE